MNFNAELHNFHTPRRCGMLMMTNYAEKAVSHAPEFQNEYLLLRRASDAYDKQVNFSFKSLPSFLYLFR